MKLTSLIFIGALLSGAAQAQNKVVFVCEHGSAKSVIAAAYFNKLAKERNIPWEAVSRGTDPDKELSSKTKQLLKKDNLLDETITPQKLTQEDIDHTQQVVLFCPLPQDLSAKDNINYWLGVQSVNDDFYKLKDEIVLRITPLIDSLAKK